MIFDKFNNAKIYGNAHPLFEKAFQFLRENDLKEIQPEERELDPSGLKAIISKQLGKSKKDAKLEAHKKFIDIQYLIEGYEEIGYKNVNACSSIVSEYDKEKDFILFGDEPDFYLKLEPGSFAVFFPDDAHAPMISNGEVKKVVFKVKV